MISEELIQVMRKLREEGYSYSQISLKLQIHHQTVMYHTCEKYRENIKKKERKKSKQKARPDRKEYHREYKKNRYKTDPVFREKQKKMSRECKRKNG